MSILDHYEVSKDIKDIFPGMDRAGLNLYIRNTIACYGDHGVRICGASAWIKKSMSKTSRLMI